MENRQHLLFFGTYHFDRGHPAAVRYYQTIFQELLIMYLVSVIGHSTIDRYLVTQGYLRYNILTLSEKVSIHLPFDYIHYPLMLLY
ncbi:hypothetical protein ACQCVP_13905 [Rossellomorea vietnamensis]|uniref:hypothetical protein n=1 Tax=Rossellomorea vietnamensis TaxID=218284 RepID=UPI003CE899E4